MTRRPLALLPVLLLAVGGLLLMGTGVAAAHSELVASSPADGATLAKPPTKVTLTFGEPVRQQGTGLTVAGPDGSVPLPDTISADGLTVSAAWPPGLTSGRYEISYRVVSEDGHAGEGSIGFRIASASNPPEPIGSATTAAAPASSSTSTGGIPPWLWIGGGVIIIAAGIGLWRVRGSSDDE